MVVSRGEAGERLEQQPKGDPTVYSRRRYYRPVLEKRTKRDATVALERDKIIER